MVFEDLECKGQKRSFQVENISASVGSELSESQDAKPLSFSRFGKNSRVKISSGMTASTTSPSAKAKRLHICPVAIGGLASQINSLNQLFTAFGMRNYDIPSRL